MPGRFKPVLFASIFVLCSAFSFAGDMSYATHRKYFDLCSYKKVCSYCESCSKEYYQVKIKNNVDKKIKSIQYRYYSTLHERVEVREAAIEGGQIDNQQTGILNICVDHPLHWAISEIIYEDNTTASFLVDGPLKSYHQEPDECDCAKTKVKY